jgi:histidinol-phosphate aminotransferase
MTSRRNHHIQLSLNENHFPPLPGVTEAVQGAIGSIHLTLDVFGAGLGEAVAERIGVPAEHVVVGAGSAALLQQLFHVCAPGGGEVVHASPSFEAYPLMIRNAGGVPVAVPLTGYDHDLAAMAAAVTERTRAVVVCNPNNPTGTVLSRDRLLSLLDGVTADVPIVIDEAYLDFAPGPESLDAVALYRRDPRVCVVRTFSKSYGLLGLRVGYVVAHDRLAGEVRRTVPFFRANHLGQVAALAAMAAEKEMRERCDEIARERDRVRTALLAQGWTVPLSGGNFLWLALADATAPGGGADAAERFTHFCSENGVLVRGFHGQGVRVTVGDSAANDVFLSLAKKFAAGR